MIPVPFRLACQTVALAEGWPAEALVMGIASNVGWLEHHETRVKQRSIDEHERSPNIGFFEGMAPSLRKSSLKKFVTRSCLQGGDIPQNIREGTAVCGRDSKGPPHLHPQPRQERR